MVGCRYDTSVARRRRGRRSRPLFRAYYAREDTSLTPRSPPAPLAGLSSLVAHTGLALLLLSRTPELALARPDSRDAKRRDATRRRALVGP